MDLVKIWKAIYLGLRDGSEGSGGRFQVHMVLSALLQSKLAFVIWWDPLQEPGA